MAPQVKRSNSVTSRSPGLGSVPPGREDGGCAGVAGGLKKVGGKYKGLRIL